MAANGTTGASGTDGGEAEAAARRGGWVRNPSVRMARQAILNGVFRPLVGYFGRPQVFGLEHLDELDGPVIFAANHLSHMDTPTVLLALPGRLRRRTLVLAAADYFYRTRRKAAFVTLSFGTVPLERDRPGTAALAPLHALLAEGWNLLAFPEGSRSRDGRLYKGKTGLARLALDARVPVVPIGIRGTFDALPSSRSWPRRARVEVRFGRAIRFEGRSDRPIDRFALRSATDEIMYEIMVLSGQEYVDEYAHKARASHPADPGNHPATPVTTESRRRGEP